MIADTIDRTTAARSARLERLGAFTAQQQRDERYRRDRRAEDIRLRWLPQSRDRREMERANRERDVREARRKVLRLRLDSGFRRRLQAIAERVRAERKIRPPGKQPKSHHRFREQMERALAGCGEYRAILARRDAAFGRIERQRRRLASEVLAAGVLMRDTRAVRRAKVEAYREQKMAIGVREGG